MTDDEMIDEVERLRSALSAMTTARDAALARVRDLEARALPDVLVFGDVSGHYPVCQSPPHDAAELDRLRARISELEAPPVVPRWSIDISDERQRQTRKFGDQVIERNPGLALAILMEEVGEVAEAILKREGLAALRDELVQVAAVCVQWIENLDRAVLADAERCIEKLVSGADGEVGQ